MSDLWMWQYLTPSQCSNIAGCGSGSGERSLIKNDDDQPTDVCSRRSWFELPVVSAGFEFINEWTVLKRLWKHVQSYFRWTINFKMFKYLHLWYLCRDILGNTDTRSECLYSADSGSGYEDQDGTGRVQLLSVRWAVWEAYLNSKGDTHRSEKSGWCWSWVNKKRS